MVAALAYLPFRVVSVPTAWAGRVAAWLADGYRTGTAVERALIFPSWAFFRVVFIAGCGVAHTLHTAARRALRH